LLFVAIIHKRHIYGRIVRPVLASEVLNTCLHFGDVRFYILPSRFLFLARRMGPVLWQQIACGSVWQLCFSCVRKRKLCADALVTLAQHILTLSVHTVLYRLGNACIIAKPVVLSALSHVVRHPCRRIRCVTDSETFRNGSVSFLWCFKRILVISFNIVLRFAFQDQLVA
jgi:hypothetical protein